MFYMMSIAETQEAHGEVKHQQSGSPLSFIWPDTDVDRRAWELAKVALGTAADPHSLVQRAQEIKKVLQG